MPSKGRPDLIHFSSFRLNQMNIRTGDHVLVRATDTMDAEVKCKMSPNSESLTNLLLS